MVIIVTLYSGRQLLIEGGGRGGEGAGAPRVIKRQWLGTAALICQACGASWFTLPSSLLCLKLQRARAPNVRDHLAYGAKLVHPKVTSLTSDKPRASKVAGSRKRGPARGNKNTIRPRSFPIGYNTCEDARGKSVRGRGHNALVQQSQGPPCPLTSPAPGRRHLASPPSERGGTSFRHFRLPVVSES